MNRIGDEDYEHTQRVWKEFNMKNLGEYHDLYLQTGVVLLSTIFEAFRNTWLKHYSLDLAHFYMSPGLTWQACLKKTGVKLELLTDPNILLMFKGALLRWFTNTQKQTTSTWVRSSTLRRIVAF